MVASALVAEALLDDAQTAQLLPFAPDGAPTERVGALSLTVSDNSVPGEPLPSVNKAWISMAAFEYLTEEQAADTKLEKSGPLASILRKRMCFLVLFVQLAMTRKCDWQTSFPTNLDEETATTATSSANDRFDWSRVLRKLTVAKPESDSFKSVVATLRWAQPRFLIDWGLGPIPDNFPAMLEAFLTGPTVDCTASKWFQSPGLRMLMNSERWSIQSRHRVVEMGLSFPCGRMTTAMLVAIIGVLERFGQSSSQARKCSSVNPGMSIEFRVTSFQLSSQCVPTDGALKLLSQVVRNSRYLYFKEIQVTGLSELESDSCQRWLTDVAFPVLVPVSQGAGDVGGRKLRSGQSFPGLKILVLDEPLDTFARVGSLARCGSTIQELVTEFNKHDVDGLAAWLAFGFFHADSQSQVETLRLRMLGTAHTETVKPPFGCWSQQFVEVFRRVMSRVVSSEDLAPLYAKTMSGAKRKHDDKNLESPLDELPLPEDKRVFVDVATNTKARVQPSVRSAVVATLEDVESPFQVLRQLRGWLAVVVPGAGAGWIPRKSVLKESTLPTKVSQNLSSNGVVKSFALVGGTLSADAQLKSDHATAVVGVLGLIGQQLEVLHLPFHDLESEHVAPIVTFCPNLKALNLYGNRIDDISPLVKAYEEGTSKISSLSLAQNNFDRVELIQQYTQIMKICSKQDDDSTQDRKRPSLKQLVVRFTLIDDLLGPAVDSFYVAWKQSPRLEYTRVYTSMDLLTHGAGGPSQSQIKPPTRPLNLSSKLAMLSAVHHTPNQQSLLSALDARVLSLIFSLAGSCQVPLQEIVPEDHDAQ